MPTSSEPLTFYPVLLVSLKQRSAYDISIFIIFPSHDWIVSPPGNYVCPHVHIFGWMLLSVISMQPSSWALQPENAPTPAPTGTQTPPYIDNKASTGTGDKTPLARGEPGRRGMTSEWMLNKMLTSVGWSDILPSYNLCSKLFVLTLIADDQSVSCLVCLNKHLSS